MVSLVYDYSGISSRLEEIQSGHQEPHSPAAPEKRSWIAPHPRQTSWVDIRDRVPDVSVGGNVGPNSIFFSSGKNSILGQDDVLDRMARTIKLASDTIVEIHAHTDAQGDHFANMQLAAERGLMVRHALMARGVEGRRIEVTSHGPDRPQVRASPDASEQKRMLADCLNRRVDVRLMTKRAG